MTFDGSQDYFFFIELFRSVYPDLSETDVRRQFNAIRQDPAFITQTQTGLKDDLPCSEVRKEEEEYFAHSKKGAESLARQLTEEADIDEEFVADKRVWERVEEQLENTA